MGPPKLRGALGGAAGVERAIGAAGISCSGIYHNANLAIVLGWKGLCSCWDGVPALLNVLNLRSASVLNIKQRISAGFTGYHLCRVSISMWSTGSPTQTCCMLTSDPASPRFLPRVNCMFRKHRLFVDTANIPTAHVQLILPTLLTLFVIDTPCRLSTSQRTPMQYPRSLFLVITPRHPHVLKRGQTRQDAAPHPGALLPLLDKVWTASRSVAS